MSHPGVLLMTREAASNIPREVAVPLRVVQHHEHEFVVARCAQWKDKKSVGTRRVQSTQAQAPQPLRHPSPSRASVAQPAAPPASAAIPDPGTYLLLCERLVQAYPDLTGLVADESLFWRARFLPFRIKLAEAASPLKARVLALLKDRQRPLEFQDLEAESPWFASHQQASVPLRLLLEVVGFWTIDLPDGRKALSPLSAAEWRRARDMAKAEWRVAIRNGTALDDRGAAKGIAAGHLWRAGAELGSVLADELLDLAKAWVARENKPRRRKRRISRKALPLSRDYIGFAKALREAVGDELDTIAAAHATSSHSLLAQARNESVSQFNAQLARARRIVRSRAQRADKRLLWALRKAAAPVTLDELIRLDPWFSHASKAVVPLPVMADAFRVHFHRDFWHPGVLTTLNQGEFKRLNYEPPRSPAQPQRKAPGQELKETINRLHPNLGDTAVNMLAQAEDPVFRQSPWWVRRTEKMIRMRKGWSRRIRSPREHPISASRDPNVAQVTAAPAVTGVGEHPGA